jgi:hypothetical protein
MIKNPWVFYGIGGLLVAYLLYMMLRGRKGPHADLSERDAEL